MGPIDEPIATAPHGSLRWDPSLTARMRVLLHGFPLFGLRENDDRRREDLRHYDAVTLAVRTMDLIVENMGLVDETDSDRVRRELAPLLHAMDLRAEKTPNVRRHHEMAEYVLDLLRNEADRRRPFDVQYTDFDDGGAATKRKLHFRLVVEEFHPSGKIVLRLTNEALNLFLNALDQDIESAQAAAEAVVENQLRRGKFEDAARSAQTARTLSIRYQDKIQTILRETRRDLSRVDWAKEVPAILNDAIDHIDLRQKLELGVIRGAQQKLRDLPPDDNNTTHVAEIVRTMRDCQQRHAELHGHLIGARTTFLDEQARQAFTPTPFRFQPDLVEDALGPLMGLSIRDANTVLNDAMPKFIGARAPALLSLAGLVDWQTRPRREIADGLVPMEQYDLASIYADLSKYSAEQRAQAEHALAQITSPTQLSVLLDEARARGASDDDCELLALLALRHYAPETGSMPIVSVRRIPGRKLRDSRLYGDDLEVAPRGDA